MMIRNRLICTVGTSLLGNATRDDHPHEDLRRYAKEKNWGQFVNALARIDPTDRLCGAEINSITDGVKRGKVDRLKFLHFLVSATDDGRAMGSVLDAYFTEKAGSDDFPDLQNIHIETIDDLDDTNPARFKVYGLRNLVRAMGTLVRDHTAEALVIDATGGYKAQIAIGVVFGQALGIPVLYRHERFSEIIDIPPMPITFDYGVLGRNAALLAAFERGEALSGKEIDGLDENVRVLLEEIEVDGEHVFAMGAVGEILLTGFRSKFPRNRQLTAVAADDRQPPSFRDDHYPIGFKEFVGKVWDETPWIKTCHSLPYHKQKAIKGVGFDVFNGGDGKRKLVGTYQDKGNSGWRFEILTDADGDDQLAWAADQLNQQYGKLK